MAVGNNLNGYLGLSISLAKFHFNCIVVFAKTYLQTVQHCIMSNKLVSIRFK